MSADQPIAIAPIRGNLTLRRGLGLLKRAATAFSPARARRSSGRRQGQRGRTAVLWAVGGFILLQLAYYPAGDVWPMLRDVEYGDKLSNFRSHLARKPKDKPSVVMFGSSLTGWGFNPSQLETIKAGSDGQPVAFNFGINSGGVMVELICIRRLLASSVKPDLIILETHPQFLFREYNTVPGEHFLEVWRYQRQDLDVLRRYDAKYHEFRNEWRTFQELPWYTQRHEAQKYLIPHWGRRIGQTDAVYTCNDRNGWEYIPSALAAAEKYTHQQIVYSAQHRIHALNQFQMDDRFKQAYREIVETCRRHGVQIVMVRMPEMTYALKYYSVPLKQNVDEFYAKFTSEMDVPLIDASEWVDDRHFCDGFHLHPDGAAVFTKRLERELLGSFFADRVIPERHYSPRGSEQ